MRESGIERAVAAAGSQKKLARLLGCSQQNVSGWARRGWVPVGRAVEVEQLTGVPRDQLIKPRLRGLLDTGV